MTFEEAYQQIRENHYKILDERESISKSARLSLSTWILDILTECRDTDTPQTEDFPSTIEDWEDEYTEQDRVDCSWK